MAFELTDRASQASTKEVITPQLVLEIDGVDTLYGATVIKKIVKIGDFEIGQPGIFIGGQIAIVDQESLITFNSGTSTDISQVLNQDKGTNESISTMQIALIDQAQKITKLITPDEIVPDLLGRKCKVWLGFSETSWRDDYIIIFRGVIDDIQSQSGVVVLNLAASESLKKSAAFPKASTKLTANMLIGDTTANVEATADFLSVYTGPSGIDTSLKLYVRINDEIMRYESSTGTSFGTLTRGALNTVASAHNSGDSVDSFYVIEGNVIDLALKLMLSGKSGNYVEDIQASNFVTVTGTGDIPNTIFFADKNLEQLYNVRVGDYVTTTGASNGANNVTEKEILSVTQTDTGYYIEVDGVTFVTEVGTAAVVGFRSQYDVWGDNAGLAMGADEVDIDEHLDIKSKYLPSSEMRIYIKDTIDNGQEFLANELYNPVSAFALPRKSQASVGIHRGPTPLTTVKTLSGDNVLNASKLKIRRTTNKNFFNSVIYRFQEDPLEDRFTSGYVTIDGTSITQIPVGNKPLIIDSKGLRDDLSGSNIAQVAGQRRLRKYKFGAEFIQDMQVNFKTGFDLEVGDPVIVDFSSLKLSDIRSASREGEPRLFEIVNKKLSLKTGQISLDVVDTNRSLDVRYALIAPASFVKTGVSQSEFVIEPSFNTSKYGTNEYKKWEKYIGAYVIVHNSDFSVSGGSYIASLSGNTVLLTSNLGFVPAAGYVMEFGDYDNQPESVKLLYGFMSDGNNNFGDGKIPYKQS